MCTKNTVPFSAGTRPTTSFSVGSSRPFEQVPLSPLSFSLLLSLSKTRALPPLSLSFIRIFPGARFQLIAAVMTSSRRERERGTNRHSWAERERIKEDIWRILKIFSYYNSIFAFCLGKWEAIASCSNVESLLHHPGIATEDITDCS